MSLLDRLDVPEAKSRASTRPTARPRVTASRAQPAPTTPPPMTRTSTSVPARAVRAASREPGESAVMSVHVHPVERPLHGFLPATVSLLTLLGRPLRLPALGFVPVLPELVGVLPEADRQTRGVRRAQSRRLG